MSRSSSRRSPLTSTWLPYRFSIELLPTSNSRRAVAGVAEASRAVPSTASAVTASPARTGSAATRTVPSRNVPVVGLSTGRVSGAAPVDRAAVRSRVGEAPGAVAAAAPGASRPATSTAPSAPATVARRRAPPSVRLSVRLSARREVLCVGTDVSIVVPFRGERVDGRRCRAATTPAPDPSRRG
ncbi:hypothetical protein IU11_17820 [Cellulosimicrobium sp. MM]|nr:hypothetical protein IU11_17820 [Cellulosimicrobium sp. MM]